MDTIETNIRRIVSQADINVITKRLVRTEYTKLTGTGTLSAEEKKAINAVLGKIIAEIAQKMQGESHSNEVTDDKRVQKDNPRTDNVITLGYQNEEMRTLSVCTQNERNKDSEKDTKMSHSQTKVVNGTAQKSFVLAHPVCNSSALEPSQFCPKSSSKSKLMTSSEALMCVLESDDARSDNSSSEFFDSPQKKTLAGYTLSKKSNISGSPDRKNIQSCEKQNATRCDILNTGERLSSEIAIAINPNKQYKTQGLDLSNAYRVNNDRYSNRSTNSTQNSGSHRNVHNFLKELYSKSCVSYTPENNCSKSSSLDFLTMNSQKCRQDCVIDSSSDNHDVHLVDVNLVTCLSDQEKCNVNCKGKINCAIVSSSDSENCFSVTKTKQRCRLDESAHEKVVKRDLLPIAEVHSSSSSELCAVVVCGCEVTSSQHRDANWDSDSFVPVEFSMYHDSSDSSSPIRRSARFKVSARKRILDDSDSDFQLSGSPQKNTSYKPKRNVMMKIVDKNSSDVEVIKYGVISDSEILERIESKAERTFCSQIRRERKSFSGSKHFKAKKQPLKILKSKTCNVYNCDLDNSLENVTCSQSLKHAQNSNQTSKPTKSVYDLNDDSDDVPLSSLNSYRTQVSGRNASASCHRSGVEKCSVVISSKEKEISDCARNNGCNESSYQLGSMPQDCLLTVSSSILNSSQKIPFRLRQITKHTENDSADSSCDSTSRSNDHHSHRDEQVTSSEVRTPQISDSDDSLPVTSSEVCTPQISDSDDSLPRLSHISPVCSPPSTTTHCITKKSCLNIELANLRMICRKLGLILRSTVELAGCNTDTEKINRIKQLLKDRGMQGKPSFKKAEKLILLKEMKELECDKFMLNNQREGHCGRQMNGGSVRKTDDSSRNQPVHSSSHDVFFDLKDVITIDDSDT